MMTHADVIEGAAHCERDPRNLHATSRTDTHTHKHTHTHARNCTHTQAKAKAKAHAHTHTPTHTHTQQMSWRAQHIFGRSPRKLAHTFGGGEEAVLEEEAV